MILSHYPISLISPRVPYISSLKQHWGSQAALSDWPRCLARQGRYIMICGVCRCADQSSRNCGAHCWYFTKNKSRRHQHRHGGLSSCMLWRWWDVLYSWLISWGQKLVMRPTTMRSGQARWQHPRPKAGWQDEVTSVIVLTTQSWAEKKHSYIGSLAVLADQLHRSYS